METAVQDQSAAGQRARIKEAFDQPQWYLSRTAYNITLRAEIVREFIAGKNPGSILDIGCGDGSLSRALLGAGNRLTLLDQSEAMLKIARSRIPAEFAANVRTVTQDCLKADFAPGEFDLILCVGVLAYIHDRPPFIAKLASLLKPGGSLIIECTDSAHFVSAITRAHRRVLGLFKTMKMDTVIGTAREVVDLCQGRGLRMKSSFRYSLPLPVINKLMSQKASYKTIRALYGSASANRLAWAGNECLYHFELPGKA